MEYSRGPVMWDSEKQLFKSDVGQENISGRKLDVICTAYGKSMVQAQLRADFIARAMKIFRKDTTRINETAV